MTTGRINQNYSTPACPMPWPSIVHHLSGPMEDTSHSQPMFIILRLGNSCIRSVCHCPPSQQLHYPNHTHATSTSASLPCRPLGHLARRGCNDHLGLGYRLGRRLGLGRQRAVTGVQAVNRICRPKLRTFSTDCIKVFTCSVPNFATPRVILRFAIPDKPWRAAANSLAPSPQCHRGLTQVYDTRSDHHHRMCVPREPVPLPSQHFALPSAVRFATHRVFNECPSLLVPRVPLLSSRC